MCNGRCIVWYVIRHPELIADGNVRETTMVQPS